VRRQCAITIGFRSVAPGADHLDLAEPDVAFRGRWPWFARRPALAWFRRADHLGDPARPRGYDERFLRPWYYYLSRCEAGFAELCAGNVQITLARPACRLPTALPPLGEPVAAGVLPAGRVPFPDGSRPRLS